jgi:hypothetical protein
MKAIQFISATEEIGNTSWSLFQREGAAAFTLAERSPLPTALSTKDLSGGETQILNLYQIRRINHHAVEIDQDRAPKCISDTEN